MARPTTQKIASASIYAQQHADRRCDENRAEAQEDSDHGIRDGERIHLQVNQLAPGAIDVLQRIGSQDRETHGNATGDRSEHEGFDAQPGAERQRVGMRPRLSRPSRR